MTGRHAIPPAPVPAPDPFDKLDKMEAAAYLEAMKQAAELAAEVDPELAAELELERAEARSLFVRKFFEFN